MSYLNGNAHIGLRSEIENQVYWKWMYPSQHKSYIRGENKIYTNWNTSVSLYINRYYQEVSNKKE